MIIRRRSRKVSYIFPDQIHKTEACLCLLTRAVTVRRLGFPVPRAVQRCSPLQPRQPRPRPRALPRAPRPQLGPCATWPGSRGFCRQPDRPEEPRLLSRPLDRAAIALALAVARADARGRLDARWCADPAAVQRVGELGAVLHAHVERLADAARDLLPARAVRRHRCSEHRPAEGADAGQHARLGVTARGELLRVAYGAFVSGESRVTSPRCDLLWCCRGSQSTFPA